MTHESKLRNEVEADDSESQKLISEHQPQYGATRKHSTASSDVTVPVFEDSDESSEEIISSVNLANRKKKRLQKHHRPHRPKLVTTLSHIVRSARQSEDEDDLNDVIDMPSNDLIIPELDPK
jgi:hypothetical protein